MKKIVPMLTGISLTGFIVSLVLLSQTDWGFSILFKLALIFLSSAIGLFAYWKSSYIIFVAIWGIICTGLSILILFSVPMYLLLWNFVLALHILLVGYTLFRLSQFPFRSILLKIIQTAIVITTVLFFLFTIFKTGNSLLFTSLLILLILTSILFVAGQMYGMIGRKNK